MKEIVDILIRAVVIATLLALDLPKVLILYLGWTALVYTYAYMIHALNRAEFRRLIAMGQAGTETAFFLANTDPHFGLKRASARNPNAASFVSWAVLVVGSVFVLVVTLA